MTERQAIAEIRADVMRKCRFRCRERGECMGWNEDCPLVEATNAREMLAKIVDHHCACPICLAEAAAILSAARGES